MDSVSVFTSQITLGAVFSWLLQVLKGASWFPILTQDSEKFVKVLFGMITSACAITGLTYVFDPAAHTLVISNFSLALVGHAAWQWLTQFVFQEGWYQLAYKKVAVARVGATGSIAGSGLNIATAK